ncbi:hypothetical protein KQI84_19410 [bacterium]|nr:hypothetical protein [bacterium]
MDRITSRKPISLLAGICLALATLASAATMTVSWSGGAQQGVLIDTAAGTASSAPAADPFSVPLVYQPGSWPPVSHVLSLIGSNGVSAAPVTLHVTAYFDAGEYIATTSSPNGSNLIIPADPHIHVAVTEFDLPGGEDPGWIGLDLTISTDLLDGTALVNPYGDNSTVWFNYFPIAPSADPEGRIAIDYNTSHEITDLGQDQGTDDYWYKLTRTELNPEFSSGAAIPEDGLYVSVPEAGEEVSFEAFDIDITPTTTTTDSEGRFGAVLRVKPEVFYGFSSSRGLVERGPASARGSFSWAKVRMAIRYKEIVRERKITGNFCEVVELNGGARWWTPGIPAVTLVKGDILAPGSIVELDASAGDKTSIVLRFVSGQQLAAFQDLATNACLTKVFEIGQTGITDLSDVRGGFLGSFATYLCEQYAGLPNTPEEYARATAKFAVKKVASNIIPGSGAVAFVVRYTVSTAAGAGTDAVIDHVVNGSRTSGNNWAEFDTYYDGSTRLVTSGGSFTYSPDGGTPIQVPAGEWREIGPDGNPSRSWIATPADIDTEGPDVDLTYTIFGDNPSIGLCEIAGRDISGLDPTGPTVLWNGNDVSSALVDLGGGQWKVDDLFGAGYLDTVEVHLSDALGHETVRTWTSTAAPPAPTVTSAIGNETGWWATVAYELPAVAAEEHLGYYQVRQAGAGGTTTDGPWLSVGRINEVRLPLLSTYTPGKQYRWQIRVVGKTGLIGPSASGSDTFVGYARATSYAEHLIGRLEFPDPENFWINRNWDTIIDVGDLVKSPR